MNKRQNHRTIGRALLALLVGSTLFVTVYATQAVSKNELFSVVQILIITDKDEVHSSGSGTIIDAQGNILTNAHVLEPAIENDGWYPVVLFTIDPKRPPIPLAVRIKLKGYNDKLDLAVLRIEDIKTESGEYQDFRDFLADEDLEIEHVRLDRNTLDANVEIGDAVQVLGYPGAGGENITLTKGTVSGFETIEVDGEYIPIQIKTDAKVNPGNSGGATFDANDNFIGVPTAVAGGRGNIGYLVALPVINVFLDKVLGPPIKNPTGDLCPDLLNGYLGEDGACYCNPGYGWNDATQSCVEKTTDLPGSTITPLVLTDAYCQENVRPNSVFNPATGNCECKSGLVLVQNDCVPKPAPKYFLGTPKTRKDLTNCLVVTDTKQKTYWLRGHKAIKSMSLRSKMCVASEGVAIRAGYRRIR